jgi:hypothetical protein
MKLRISLHARYLALFGALGLVPLACDGATTGTDEFPCSASTPDIVMGQESGYETCTEGQRHRATAVQCASELPRATSCDSGDPMFPGTCASDADCTDNAHGQCGIFGQIGECSCNYGCVTDSDCADGQICDCGEPAGQCVRADCATDDDCAEGLLCVAYVSNPGCGGTAFTCQTDADTCGSDADCQDGANCTQIDGHLECQMQACDFGRPFLVAGAHRSAEIESRADWCDVTTTPNVDDLPSALRETLAAHWREVGLMEHASIAAFARFAMQLLAVGAPPELLLETQDAMRDETQHARLAFALASAYADADVGPGRLEIEGALEDGDPRDILRMVIHEGCIGETVAALEAAEAAEHASDPVVKRVLEQIACDEQRHAELAWRYVAWAVEQDSELGLTLLSEIRTSQLEAKSQVVADRNRALLAHGVMTDAMRSELRSLAISRLIAPAAQALASQRMAA